jgi:ligand-binding sensor domain-containing protein
MKQDDMGFLWIATWNGLSRFDGYNFYNYQTGAGSHIPNLHNRILDLSIDSQQNVWMRMYDNRVFVMKRSIDQIVNPFEELNGSDEFRTNCPITVASNGDVLVSIDGVGIYRVKTENDKFTCQLITTSGLTITSMAEGYQGDIWLGTDQGVHLMDFSNQTVERKGQFLDEYITVLFSDGYNIFAGTQSGKVLTFAYGTEPRQIYHGESPIHSLFVDSHGLIWLCDDRQGAVRVKPDTGEERLYEQHVMVPDYDGAGGSFHEAGDVLWIAMNHGGYGYYNRETEEIEYFHNDPSNPWNLLNTVNATAETEEGVVFESTGRRGLEKLDIMKNTISRVKIVSDATSNLENETRALYYDRERHLLLVGNKANSVFIYNDDGALVATINHDDNGNPIGRCYGLTKDSKGNYWLSSKDHGLFCITPMGSSYSVVNYCHDDDDPNTLSNNGAYAAVEDGQGNIWVATYGGGVNVLTRNKQGQKVFLHHKNGMPTYPYRSHLKVRSIALNSDGNVWAGTTDGILIMSYANGEVKMSKLEESEEFPDSILMSNDIVCLGLDPKGSMWVGTNGGGIAHTTGKDSQGRWLFRNFSSKDGLPGDEIKCITFDKRGHVWFSTDNVICSYDTEKQIFTTFSSLDGVDDTMCSEGAAVALPNDNVLIGTVNGYYFIDRMKLVNNNASLLKLRITDFWLNDELQSPRFNHAFDVYVPESRRITLQSHNDKIAIRFAALNYQLQHRVHYQYMLEGYDKTWKNAPSTRIATYSGLPTGTYTFKVKAFLLESPEQADIREIAIEVPPHFFMSTKAIWLYMIVAATVLLTLLFWRQNKLRREYAPDTPEGPNGSENAEQRRRWWSSRRKEEPTGHHEETDKYEYMN